MLELCDLVCDFLQEIIVKRLPWVFKRDLGLLNSADTVKNYGDF